MLDLGPATQALTTVVVGITDDQLTDRTPCEELSVADLLDHVDGLAQAFTGAAAKEPGADQPPQPDGSRLVADWRRRIPARLAELAAAWRDESAWQGMTRAGGIEFPGEVAGLVSVDEVVVHGWDLAAATGQPYEVDPGALAAAREFVRAAVAESPEGTPGLFGPPVEVPADSSPLDQLIALTGRDPRWRP